MNYTLETRWEKDPTYLSAGNLWGDKGLLKNLVPNQYVKSIYDIDLHVLKSNGIKGIITDLDNTLVGAKEPYATPQLLDWLMSLKQMGFQVVIVSNNNKLRVSRFAEPLVLPFIHKAMKPINRAFHKALGIMKLTAADSVVIGDQMLTDVFGGNRMGLHTILVSPISINDESFLTKINRLIEKIVLAGWRKKGGAPWEERN